MEQLNDLIFLMPDYELEGYPRSLPDEQAALVLSGWVALWHPVLMCGAGRIPRWHQVSKLPTDLTATLFVLPPISKESIAIDAAEQISQAGGRLLEPTISWREFQSQLVSLFPGLVCNDLSTAMSGEFAALGYAFLQVQLMTRQLRYTSNLDVAMFEDQVLKATEAVMDNNEAEAKKFLQSGFDSLGQERDHYYSNEAHLLDITLLAESTLGKSLERQLTDLSPTSFVASASLLRKLAEKSAASMQVLQDRIQQENACIVGGLDEENPWPLMPPESIIRELYRAPEAYRRLGIDPPTVFGRLSYGLTSDAPSLLSRFGFRGALLMAFTGGSYPKCAQPKISWESHDGTRLPALAGTPLDANCHASFLALGWSIGEALDRQHVPTIVLAHWPGRTSEYLELLQIVAARTPALGRFNTLDRYFADTNAPYHHERLDASGFSFNWLAECENPSHLVKLNQFLHTFQCRLNSLQNIGNLIWQLNNVRNKIPWAKDDDGHPQTPAYTTVPLTQWAEGLDEVLTLIDQLAFSLTRQVHCATSNESDESDLYVMIQSKMTALKNSYLKQLGALLFKTTVAQGVGPATGRLLFNPRSNPVRVVARTPKESPIISGENWNFASGMAGNEHWTCVDVPAMGFVIAPFDKGATSTSDKFVLADAAGMLRNEFIEVQIDTNRGHLKSLHVPAKRGNRLSVMIAYREKQQAKLDYSTMTASKVSLIAASNMLGILRVEGNLIWRQNKVADFQIDYEIRRGSRLVTAEISLSNLEFTDEQNPWRSAFVLRVAWPTEAAVLRSYPEGRRTTWNSAKIVASNLIEIDEVEYQTQYLPGGLGFHSRQEARFLETILAVHGQEKVSHRVAFAVDLPHALSAAHHFMDSAHQLPISGAIKASSGWLVNVDTRSVHVELQSPLQDEQGHNVGMRVLIMEVGGKSTTANIQFFQDLKLAQRVDYSGTKISRVTTEGDTLTIPLRAGEQSLVDLLWAAPEN